MIYSTTLPLIHSAATALQPPRRVTVAQGAEEALVIRQPGGYSGAWSPTEAPYMVEPMNTLASRSHEAVCFIGPARTGKTMGLLDGWMAYAVTCDPGDMLITQMSQEKAREFSKIRIDRAIRNSPVLRSLMSTRGHDDNTHDKMFRNGMWVKIGWPAATQLSSSDYRYTAGTDYDRWPDDIDGEGSGFALLLKRTQTFLSRGMCMIETSPGRDWTDPQWTPSTPHEAPPCNGGLGIYNRGDRNRWYWQCPDCSEYFEAKPGLDLFATLPPEEELLDLVRSTKLPELAAHHARVVCPHCGSIIEQRWKPHLNSIKTARWVAEGQSVTKDGELIGDRPMSNIASYWLGGVAAAYQKWDSILLRYLQALREYAMSGSDLSLKATINTDQGMPYFPRALKQDQVLTADSRGEDGLPRFFVPDEARFLLAFVDVQGGARARFVVQVHAIGPQMEQWIVDRYDITDSVRGKDFRIDPAAYLEDWNQLTERVVKATYRLHDGREMMIRRVGVDLGGEAGVTPSAQAWHAAMVREGFGDRVRLMKGDGHRAGSRAITPVVQSRLRGRSARGTTPYLSVQSDYFKDQIDASKRRRSGPAAMHFPSWLKQWFYDELSSEVRGADGKWRKIKNGRPNEALDCWVGINALAFELGPNNPKINFAWDTPPTWASRDDGNPYIVTQEDRRNMKATGGTNQPPPSDEDHLFSPIPL